MVRRKKVLFFIESLSGGGAEKVLTDLVTNVNPEKYDLTVCAFVGKGMYVPTINEKCNYFEILPDPDKLKGIYNLLFRLKYKLYRSLPPSWAYRLMFKNKYDTEVAFIEGFCTKIIGASHRESSRKIAWVHLDLYVNHYTREIYNSLNDEIDTYKCFDKIICVSENVKEAFRKLFGDFYTLEVKYNPINSELIRRKATEIGATTTDDLSHKDFEFIAIGRLEPQKRFDRLIKIARNLKSEGFSFQIVILGEGSLRDVLEDLIDKYKVSDVIHLQGFIKNPFPKLHKADALLCSSKTEGYSTVVSEALILGVPVITTDCAGMREQLGDNEYGIITENSSNALEEGIKAFMIDAKLQKKLQEKSMERGKEFKLGHIINEVTKIL